VVQIELGGFEQARKVFRRRAVLLVFVMLASAAGLAARWNYLQVVQFEHYALQSKENGLALKPVGPERGMIHDRNGVVLADNTPSYSLFVGSDYAQEVLDKIDTLGEVVELRPLAIEQLREAASSPVYKGEVQIKGLMTEEEVSRFVSWQFYFPEVVLRAGFAREYPRRNLAAHVIGHVGRINQEEKDRMEEIGKHKTYRGSLFIGKSGVEDQQENLLHGLPGTRQVEIDAHGRVLRSIERVLPRRGQDIYLTLDSELQQLGEALLGDESGAIVMLDVWTGEILALVSSPRFDLNLFVHGIDHANWDRLNGMEERPLVHRAIYGQYAPGSTIKPFLALAALERGWRDPDYTYRSIGHFQLTPTIRFHDWKAGGHGEVGFAKSIIRSVNSFYYQLAHDVGVDEMAEGLRAFGFGAPTGVDLPGEKGGIVPTQQWKREARDEPWYPGDTIPVGVGQGYLHATPLQMARAMAVIANGGRMIRPHLLLSAQDRPSPERLAAVSSSNSGPERALFSRAHVELVRDALSKVTQPGGTALSVGRDSPYPIAGKTGTAQVSRLRYDAAGNRVKNEDLPKRLRDHAWFVGYAPADLPLVSIAVIVEHGGSGGRTAGPVARAMLDERLLGRDGIAAGAEPERSLLASAGRR